MHRLTLFGTVHLECDGVPLTRVVARKRLLALLALLACRTGRRDIGVSRDELLVYLWPESRTEHARNSLSQALHALRAELGHDTILGTTVLRLSPVQLSCDWWEFDEHLAQGRLEAAVGLRRGPLFTGLSINGLAELDEWLDAERKDTERRFHEALEELAHAAESEPDGPAASRRWWRALLREVPTSATATIGVMRSYAAVADYSNVLAEAERHASCVRADGGSVHADILAFSEHYRAQRAVVPRVSDPAAVGVRPSPFPPYRPPESTDATVLAVRPGSPLRRKRMLAAIGALALTTVTVAGAISLVRTGTPAVEAASSLSSVLIFPTSARGDRASDLALSFAPLLESALAGVPGLRALGAGGDAGRGRSWTQHPADALASAKRAGASYAVLSDAISDDVNRVRIHTRLIEVRTGLLVGEGSVQGTRDDVFALADTTASLVLQRWAASRHAAVVPRRGLLLVPVSALRAYMRGEAALRADQFSAAIGAYREALGIDSTFALAWYRLSIAAEWDGRGRLSADAAEHAQAHCGTLPEHERTLLTAHAHWRRGDLAAAQHMFRQGTEQEPGDPEAWFALAEMRFHAGPLMGRSVTAARAAFERALALDSMDAESAMHLARIASIEHRTRDADSLMNVVRRITPDSAAVNLRAFRAFALGDRPGLKRVTRDILAGEVAIDEATALTAAVHVGDVVSAERFAQSLMRAGRAPEVRAYGLRLLAQAALARGQVSRAEGYLARSAIVDPVPTLELRSLAAAIPELGYPLDSVRSVAAAVERWSGNDAPDEVVHSEAHAGLHQLMRLHRLGLLAVRLGDTVAARMHADRLLSISATARERPMARALGWSVRARIAAGRGDSAAALEALDLAEWPRAAEVFTAEIADRYLRAAMLTALGRQAEAVGWLESMAQRATYELVLLAPAELRLAEIEALRGNRAGAVAHYDAFLGLWSDAEAPLAAVVDAARRTRAMLKSRTR
jgi:DNA-binding SARP family transcriptional activator/tetratricopeptide (TPR) repeat protein